MSSTQLNETEATTTEVTETETETVEDARRVFKMSNSTYDTLKWIAQIALPAVITFYAAIGTIWNIPFTDATVATIAAINALLGTMLHVSTQQYNRQ